MLSNTAALVRELSSKTRQPRFVGKGLQSLASNLLASISQPDPTTTIINGEKIGRYLSYQQGNLPRELAIKALPASHSIWDDLATRLPCLVASYQVEETLRNMPILPAGADALPAQYLTRAAILLTGFMHAYYYQHTKSGKPNKPLADCPASITSPLKIIAQRLGRDDNLSRLYSDDFGLNWLFCDDKKTSINAQNVKPLLTYFNIPEETQTVLTAGPLSEYAFKDAVLAMAEAQDAMLNNNHELLYASMVTITRAFEGVSTCLQALLPNPRHERPLSPSIFGNSFYLIGTATHDKGKSNHGSDTALFNVADAFFHRDLTLDELGAISQERLPLKPKEIMGFCEALRQGPAVIDYINKLSQRPLSELDNSAAICLEQYEEMKQAYCDLLTLHIQIAYIYFKVVLFTSDEDTKPWLDLYHRLRLAKLSRFEADHVKSLPRPMTQVFFSKKAHYRSAKEAALPSFTPATIARHHTVNPWIIIKGKIYDMTEFMDKHPAGNETILLSLGKYDTDFSLIHGDSRHLLQKIAPYHIGNLCLTHADKHECLYENWLKTLYTFINIKHFLKVHFNQAHLNNRFYLYDNLPTRFAKQALLPALNKFLLLTDDQQCFVVTSGDLDLKKLLADKLAHTQQYWISAIKQCPTATVEREAIQSYLQLTEQSHHWLNQLITIMADTVAQIEQTPTDLNFVLRTNANKIYQSWLHYAKGL